MSGGFPHFYLNKNMKNNKLLFWFVYNIAVFIIVGLISSHFGIYSISYGFALFSLLISLFAFFGTEPVKWCCAVYQKIKTDWEFINAFLNDYNEIKKYKNKKDE